MSSVCIEGSEDGGGVVCGGSVHVQCVYRGVRGWGRGSVWGERTCPVYVLQTSRYPVDIPCFRAVDQSSRKAIFTGLVNCKLLLTKS